jgi:hypothetical protein
MAIVNEQGEGMDKRHRISHAETYEFGLLPSLPIIIRTFILLACSQPMLIPFANYVPRARPVLRCSLIIPGCHNLLHSPNQVVVIY